MATRKTKAELEAELVEANDQLDTAHGLVANAGDWINGRRYGDPESKEWREAARRWIDGYGEYLSRSIGSRPEPEPEEEPEEEPELDADHADQARYDDQSEEG